MQPAWLGHGDARPLLARGRLVTVDGHPICADCGAAVVPVGVAPDAVVAPGTVVPGTVVPGTVVPGTVVPGTVVPGTVVPGTVVPGTVVPGTVVPGTVVPGTVAPGATAAGAGPHWEHLPAGRRFSRRSPWFTPVTWASLAGLSTYREFVAHYPWTTRPELCGGVITSEADWREGVARLREYHARLTVARRHRVLRPGENPYLDLARVLAGPDATSTAAAPSAGATATASPSPGTTLTPGPNPGTTLTPSPTNPDPNTTLTPSPTTPGATPTHIPNSGAGLGPDLSWSVPGGVASVLNLPARRRELAALFAWAIPGEDALRTLGEYGPLVECGAGTGYWAALLRARGVDVRASDLAPGQRSWTGVAPSDVAPEDRSRTPVAAASAVAAVRSAPDRTLLLCWPPYDDDGASYAALRAYRGEVLLYVGGGPGGATGTVRFHRELELNWSVAGQAAVPNWPGLTDRLVVYRRNARRRPQTRRDRCDSCRRFLPTGAAGRCDACFGRNPPALALRIHGHRVEYPKEVVDAMPPGLRLAFEHSRDRIRSP